jgi:hypothetical protein
MNTTIQQPTTNNMDQPDQQLQQLQQHLQTYYEQLTPFERQTCDIAREHLGSSFDLARSNGFLRWLSKKR